LHSQDSEKEKNGVLRYLFSMTPSERDYWATGGGYIDRWWGTFSWPLLILFLCSFLSMGLSFSPWRTDYFWITPFYWIGGSILYTGLFIYAHDAMHGTLVPHGSSLNRWIGKASLFLYGGFSFTYLSHEHGKHHLAPASETDPDYHDGKHSGFFSWYFRFMAYYFRWWTPLYFTILFLCLNLAGGFAYLDLIMALAVPALLSSVQLFYFGTYRTHREPKDGYNSLRAHSNNYSYLVSLLTCFHFGYHYEHHFAPFVPWWRLPSFRKWRLSQGEAEDAK
jgi:beta-carotene/zeaxanthin 4-ketolase